MTWRRGALAGAWRRRLTRTDEEADPSVGAVDRAAPMRSRLGMWDLMKFTG
jgi:hypothetical protein